LANKRRIVTKQKTVLQRAVCNKWNVCRTKRANTKASSHACNWMIVSGFRPSTYGLESTRLSWIVHCNPFTQRSH